MGCGVSLFLCPIFSVSSECIQVSPPGIPVQIRLCGHHIGAMSHREFSYGFCPLHSAC